MPNFVVDEVKILKIFSLNQILSGNLQVMQLRNKMIRRFKGLSKSLGAVETFHLFSEDLGYVVWE